MFMSNIVFFYSIKKCHTPAVFALFFPLPFLRRRCLVMVAALLLYVNVFWHGNQFLFNAEIF